MTAEIHVIDSAQVERLYHAALGIFSCKAVQLSRKERFLLYEIQSRIFESLDDTMLHTLERAGEALVKLPTNRKKQLSYTLPPIGAIMVKYWRGKRLEIKRVEGGFEYQQEQYESLSQLARKIAGYSVSGPIFFGLRKAKQDVA